MSITFNGTNQYLERTTTVGAFFPLTISAWFKTDRTTTAQVLWSESSTFGQSRHSFYIDTDSKLKSATVNTSGILYTAVSTNSVTTNWHHGAAYFASNSNRSVFLDGVENNTTTSPAPTVGGRNRTNIGCRYAGSTTPGVYFDGSIAELCIWTVQLTAGEITALANGAPALTIRPASILSYYPLGGFFGNSGNDFSNGGRNMTSVNTPTYSDHPALWFPQTNYFSNVSIPSQMWINVSGVWKTAIPWINVAGTWKTATPNIKVSGVWK